MSRSVPAPSSQAGVKPGISTTRPSHASPGAPDFRADMDKRQIRAKRPHSAHSSQGSVDSVLIEHFTSSESSENGDDDHPPPPRSASEAVERRHLAVPVAARGRESPISFGGRQPRWTLDLWAKAPHFVAKYRAKRLFTQLVAYTVDPQAENPSKRRRHDAASGLLEMASRGPEGKDIVAHKFIKTAEREENCVRALFKLNDDELLAFQSWLWEEPEYPFASTANDLIDLVIARSPGGTFFRSTLPKVLQDETCGVGAILILVDKHPDFFTHINLDLVFKFGAQFVEEDAPLSATWRRGVRLLFIVLDRLPKAPLETRDRVYLPLLRVLLQGCAEGLMWVDENTLQRGKAASVHAVQLLKYMFRILREVKDDAEALEKIIPPRASLNRLVAALMLTFAEDRIQNGNTLNTTSLLALKSLSILLQSQEIRKNINIAVVARWAPALVDIVLQPSNWRSSLGNEAFTDEFAKINLRPETAAFDILCALPEPAFTNALAFALSQCDLKIHPLASPPYKNYRVLASLVQLSNTRRHSRKAAVALIQGGTCEYLARILSFDDPRSRSHRTFWKAKGLAMTCLGNIMEKMDREELRRHVGRGVIDSVVSIKEDYNAPTVQKGQANFVLQRYKIVAN